MRIGTLLFACALALSATAAYYSIVGLATIFSSAFLPVVIMAGILEISKLVVASWLYHKWDSVSGPIKAYLTSAVIILMMITSLGIFGFLSKAHVEQNLNNTSLRLRIEQVDYQISQINTVIQRYQTQLEQLDRSINIQLDANRASQALAARQRQTAERDQIRQRLDAEQQKLQELNQQRTAIRQQVGIIESEVGMIRYVAEFFASGQEVDMEKSVRWMIVVLVVVFDPLAVLMLIAANMSMERSASRKRNETEEAAPPVSEPPQMISIGTMMYDQTSGVHRWWNGNSWSTLDPPSIPVPAPTPVPAPATNSVDTAAIFDSVEEVKEAMERLGSVDVDTIKKIIQDSMDEC